MSLMDIFFMLMFFLVVGLRIWAGLQYGKWYDQLTPKEQEAENQRRWKAMQY